MKALAVLGSAAVLALGAAQADATIYLGMSYVSGSTYGNGGTVTTLADDGGSGTLGYNGSLFGFANTISVQGYPVLDQPDLQTASINSQRTTGTEGFLTIYLTQTDLAPVVGSLTSSFTANQFLGAAESVAMSTYYSPTNSLFGGTELGSATFTSLGSTSTTTALAGLNGPFSETTKYVIKVGAGRASVNDTINISAGAVPEPATWAMMLAGFGFIGASLRQRRRATVTYA